MFAEFDCSHETWEIWMMEKTMQAAFLAG